tara:strand:- start:70 stop:393 length:324 start_codon:yes stop_codon:yes gene_type:complete
MKYLKNPYVIVGLLGLTYWYMQRKKLKKANSNVDKSVEELDSETKDEAQANGVPAKLVEDMKSMSKDKLARNIIVNQQMLNREEMSNDERTHILKMIDYMEKELEKK